MAVLAAALIMGCAGLPAPPPAAPDPQAAPPQPAPQPKPTVNLSGYPLEFRQGYTDGCASATPNTARTRNEGRFKSDANYAQGWRDGYDICSRKK